MRISVELHKGSASINIHGLPKIHFLSDDIEPSQNKCCDFALWAILPILMRQNSTAVCDFSVSKSAYQSAILVAKI